MKQQNHLSFTKAAWSAESKALLDSSSTKVIFDMVSDEQFLKKTSMHRSRGDIKDSSDEKE